MRTWRKRLWLALAVASAALMATAFAGVILTPVPVARNVYILGLFAFPVVGGLVVARQADNLVGRLMVAVGAQNAVGVAATTYFWMSLETGLPPFDVAPWLAAWAYWPAFALMTLIMAVFPSGRLTSMWLRPVLWVGMATVALLTVTLMVVPAPVNDVFFGEEVTNPWGVAALSPLVPVDRALPVVATVLIATVATDLVFRCRRSTGVERLQMRWVGLGLLTVALLAVVGILGQAAGFSAFLIALWFSFGALPTAIGLAVIRYRLYDIDRLLSRTVSYALVAGLLGAVFAAIALWVPQLVGVSEQSPLLVAAATLVVAGLFNPLRRRVQAVVDRRFNRARYNAQQEMERFTERLRDEVELNEIAGEMLDAVEKTMQPSAATVWIRESV